jgi:two-component system nitrogen regulation sensor histidine kinase NtrY
LPSAAKKLRYILGAIFLIASLTLVIWQGSFAGSLGDFAPDDPAQTFVFYGISILIFLLMVTLGFMLVRLIVKLWLERQKDRVGSRIRTRLVVGALALSIMPVFFMVLFNFYVLNATMQKWFNRPEQHELVDLRIIAGELNSQTRDKAVAEAELLVNMPETDKLLSGGTPPTAAWLESFCQARGILAATITPPGSATPAVRFGTFPGPRNAPAVTVTEGPVRLSVAVPVDVARQRKAIEEYDRAFDQLGTQRRAIRLVYLLLLTLIALFIFFVASWFAHYLARQISGPIAALLVAAEEVSKGNLAYRVHAPAVDELARLVSGFNRMTSDLEANRAEIDSRRRFTEAILESIPTGVISVDSIGSIQRVNKAFEEILPGAARNALRLDDLFSREDTTEIRYLMNRARRTGHAGRQLEVKTPAKTLHLAITVTAIAGGRGAGFVIVVEDTSDLLRAQKTAAWSEVARRVAHEIKNPLTPITLSAERILRHAGKVAIPEPANSIMRECAETILFETASVKRLVDEFSQFSRLPAAQPVVCDLNEVISAGIGVFEDRLDNIDLQIELAPGLLPVAIDREQFKRVVVNLIDNAAEAMQDSPSRALFIQTRMGAADTVEILFADTGCGITSDQKEKLFLPYFTTKGRGTGLGLAIVSHILTEHGARVRVEDNKPCGALFIVEVPVAGLDVQTDTISPAGATLTA